MYSETTATACGEKRTEDALQICESFDAECLKRRVWLEGVDDSTLGERRGQVPKREARHPIPRKYGSEIGAPLEKMHQVA